MDTAFFPQDRAERLIAINRLILAIFSLAAVWLDLPVAGRDVALAMALVELYTLYALLVALFVWRKSATPALRLASHVFDLTLVSLFVLLTHAAASPFFAWFVFSLFCATLRFGPKGTAWTAGIILLVYLAIGFHEGIDAREAGVFLIRMTYLTTAALFLIYLGAWQRRTHGELSQLAAWPQTRASDSGTLVREALLMAARLLRVPRVLLVWEGQDEPWLQVAWIEESRFHAAREAPDRYGAIVHPDLDGKSFLTRDAAAIPAAVVFLSDERTRPWRGEPLTAALRERFAIRSVVSSKVAGETVQGRLFFLDRAGVHHDDLVLGEIVARLVAARLDQLDLADRMRDAAVTDERIRLARDLHDGLLQSLAGAALQLETIHILLERDPAAARARLRTVQEIIAADQSELRTFITQLRPRPAEAAEGVLAKRLGALAERFERQWGLAVEIAINPRSSRFADSLAGEIYSIVNEGLSNAAKHAKASRVRASIAADSEEVVITIEDNGRGFPFFGTFDLAELDEQKRGPVTLKERIASLSGSLVLTSTERGSRLEIAILL
ncbi:MAG TPA: histidine kinase [Thermoanaerobaculia bacterium]|nr:histidine kinase [Thermoanaerobaculia bacterium]